MELLGWWALGTLALLATLPLLATPSLTLLATPPALLAAPTALLATPTALLATPQLSAQASPQPIPARQVHHQPRAPPDPVVPMPTATVHSL